MNIDEITEQIYHRLKKDYGRDQTHRLGRRLVCTIKGRNAHLYIFGDIGPSETVTYKRLLNEKEPLIWKCANITDKGVYRLR